MITGFDQLRILSCQQHAAWPACLLQATFLTDTHARTPMLMIVLIQYCPAKWTTDCPSDCPLGADHSALASQFEANTRRLLKILSQHQETMAPEMEQRSYSVDVL
jgi:hypothetical protein